MKKRYREEQIIGFLKEAESGISVKDLCRRHDQLHRIPFQLHLTTSILH